MAELWWGVNAIPCSSKGLSTIIAENTNLVRRHNQAYGNLTLLITAQPTWIPCRAYHADFGLELLPSGSA